MSTCGSSCLQRCKVLHCAIVQGFCSMIAYNITKDVHTPIGDPSNVQELDDVAKDIYTLAVELRRDNFLTIDAPAQDKYLAGDKCLETFKKLLCGSMIPKCNPMNPLRPYVPCESVCHAYVNACGTPRELVCAIFGDPSETDPTPARSPFAMCKGSSSFPRFFHREWVSLMPGKDPQDEEDDKEYAMLEAEVTANIKQSGIKSEL